MALTQCSIIQHPVIHRTGYIGNIIEHVVFLPESQHPAGGCSYPIWRSGRNTFQNPQAITFPSNLIRDQAKKPRTELRSTEARKAPAASTSKREAANLHERIESPARRVHVILWRILLASAGRAFAEMRRVGRTDEEERSLVAAVSLLSSLRPPVLSRVIAFPFQVAFSALPLLLSIIPSGFWLHVLLDMHWQQLQHIRYPTAFKNGVRFRTWG
jgi:hypothetical protein